MILDKKNITELGKSFDECTTRALVWVLCDYCGTEFQRSKKEVLRSYRNLKKDSCSNRKCSVAKRKDVQTLFGEDFDKKSRATCMERYGHESAMQNETQKKKRDDTCLEKYGEKNFTQTEEYWKHRKKTCIKKYGVEHPHQHPSVIKKFKATNMERYGVDNYAKSEEAKEEYKATCLKKYGVPNPLCIQENRVFGKTEESIKDWLNSLGCAFVQDYTILDGKEIDLYDANLKLAIEYCGLYWHNECSLQPRDHRYHYDKYLACLAKGIQLITIFEDEWKGRNEQCRSILMAKVGELPVKIGARSCKLVSVDKPLARVFLEQNHLLEASRHLLFVTGLLYKGDLVAIMSLGRHPRKSKTIVMDRLCFRCGYNIAGGASKLIVACKQWATENGYHEIITWSDNRWSTGGVYGVMGFELSSELPPDYSYVNVAKPYRRISKQSQKKSNTTCPSDKSEHEWALEQGLARIWDCGKKRWKISF